MKNDAKILLWLIMGGIMIAITRAESWSADTDKTEILWNKSLNLLQCDVNATHDNSTYGYEAKMIGTVTRNTNAYVAGSGSCDFGNGGNALNFTQWLDKFNTTVNFTVMGWIDLNNNSGSQIAVSRYRTQTYGKGEWRLKVRDSPDFDTRFSILVNNEIEAVITTTDYSDGRFRFMAMYVNWSDFETVSVYNVFDGGSLQAHATGTSIPKNMSDALLYGIQEITPNIELFKGRLDEWGIFNSSLNLDIINHYKNLTGNGTPLFKPTPPPDTAFPVINISLNSTSLLQNNIVNVTGNSSDNIGLSFCQIIENQTGSNVIYNFSLSGTSGFCSQNITISILIGIVNFTARVNDTSNNKNQSSLLFLIGDTTLPTISSQNISSTTPYSDDDVNISATVTDNGIINYARAEINGTNYTLSKNGNTYQNIRTWGIGSYNITRMYASDTSNNIQMIEPNISFTVTTRPSGGSSSTGGGGGGGGSIIEEVIILGNATFILQPPIISTYFLYTPFKKAMQRFSIKLNANRILDKCISPVFECNINNNTVMIALNYSNDKDFFNKVNSSITLIDKGSFAKTISASVRFINIAYALPISFDTSSTNYAIFRLEKGAIAGIRLWFILIALIMVGSGAYIYSMTK